jgi:hypothetical protein
MQEWDAKLPKTRGGVMSIDLVLAARRQRPTQTSSRATRDWSTAKCAPDGQ